METFEDFNILIVDDGAEVREAISVMLAPLECKIYEADDGPSALDRLQQVPISLALLDIKLPSWDGVELLRHINRNYPQVTNIMLTGYGSKEQVHQALKHNAFDFLEKPIDREILLNRVINGLYQHRNIQLINMVVEEFILETFDDITPETFNKMSVIKKNNVLATGLALIKIKKNKRLVS